MSGTFESFGRIRRHKRRGVDPNSAMEALRVGRCEPAGLLAFGNGRSYGDSCHNDAGSLIAMQRGAQIHAFDPTTGIVDADAGVTLAEVIEYAAPYGFFPAVTPGTRFVTLGGAVANDVHGKNHHKRGTFGCHVESFELLRSDGKTHHCTVTQNPHLYAATIGGMGLTGVILRLRMKLTKVSSLDIEQRVTPFANLSEYFDLAEAADEENEFAVAWVDQLATGRFEGRGVLMTGNHAENGNFSAKRSRLPLRVPFDLPFAALNRTTLGLFNSAYFNVNKRKTAPHLANYQSFFYPLDSIEHWNRLYGPKGLYQHQCVIPSDAARLVIPALLAASRDAGQASFLTVLKRFGHVRSPGLMSFPQPGYTLTMDFPNQGEATLRLLDRLDRMTVEAGGRINPYKDQRMSPAAFEAGFPEWRQLERLRDPAFVSDFWRRTALALGADAAAPMAQYARGHA